MGENELTGERLKAVQQHAAPRPHKKGSAFKRKLPPSADDGLGAGDARVRRREAREGSSPTSRR